MMTRNFLTVIVPALLASGAVNAAQIYNKDGNKLDLYGKVVGEHYLSKDKSNDGDQSYVRLGFKGETQINSQLTGYGQWEYNFNAHNSEGSDAQDGNKTRLGFAGLKVSQYGSLDYGRNYGISYDTLSWTDMLPEFGGDYGYSDTMTGRSTGVLTYRNTDFFGMVDGWNFALQYQGKNNRSDYRTANGDGFGISSSYTTAMGLGVIAAYQKQDRAASQRSNTVLGQGNSAEVWNLGLKYDANNIYLATTYSEGRRATPVSGTFNNVNVKGFANKTQDFEAVAQYQFDFGLRPSLAYVQTKAKDLEGGIGNVDIVKYVELGTSFAFNKNMSTFIDYKINMLSDNNALGLAKDDIVALGLVYQF